MTSREYHRNYYQKNRTRILENRKTLRFKRVVQGSKSENMDSLSIEMESARNSNVVQLFQNKEKKVANNIGSNGFETVQKGSKDVQPSQTKPCNTTDSQKSLRLKQSISCLLLFSVIGLSEFLLLTETATFYGQFDGAQALLKALLIEAMILIFSFVKGTTRLEKMLFKGCLMGLCLYVLTALSFSIVQRANHDIEKSSEAHRMLTKSIQDGESELSKRQAFRDQLISIERYTAARGVSHEIDRLNEDLAALRNDLRSVSSAGLTPSLHIVVSLIAFRVLIMLSNILCVGVFRRVVEAGESF